MRIYRHPDDPTRIIAQQGNWQFDVARANLPANPAEALTLLWEKYQNAQVFIDPETGQPIEPPPPLELYPELDVDGEAIEEADFAYLIGKIAVEVTWLEATIPQIDTMTLEQLRATLKRMARENMEMLKAWLYVARRFSSTEKK